MRKPVGLNLDDPSMQLSHLTKETEGSLAKARKLGRHQRYDRSGFSTVTLLPSSRAILQTTAVHSAILLESSMRLYSFLRETRGESQR